MKDLVLGEHSLGGEGLGNLLTNYIPGGLSWHLLVPQWMGLQGIRGMGPSLRDKLKGQSFGKSLGGGARAEPWLISLLLAWLSPRRYPQSKADAISAAKVTGNWDTQGLIS